MGKHYNYDDIIESNKQVMDRLKVIKQDNKDTKKIAIIALSFAFFGVSLSSLFKMIPTAFYGHLIIFVSYGLGGIWLLFKANKLKENGKK